MAGVLIHDVSGYSGSAYNLKIPSLTDTANIQEAMMLFHYGIDNYDGSVEPADASVFGNLRDFDTRIGQLEATEVVALSGTANQITSSGSVGNVTLSIPSLFVAPGSIESTTHISSGGSASFGTDVEVGNDLTVSNDLSVTGDSSFTGSASFTGEILAEAGINIFVDSTERDSVLSSPIAGAEAFLESASASYLYNGASWEQVITDVNTSTLYNKTLQNAAINYGLLKSPEEVATVSTSAISGIENIDLLDSSVKYFTGDSTTNFTLNLRGANDVTLNELLEIGQSISCAILVTNGATAYYLAVIQVDESTENVTTKWQGGEAPTEGNASSVDIYTITVLKTADATFSVFAAQSVFA